MMPFIIYFLFGVLYILAIGIAIHLGKNSV